MRIKFSGSVHFANGDPVPKVQVRIFDKDATGREDDDLTIEAGITDEKGNFSLTYEPLRYLDYYTINSSGIHAQPRSPQGDEIGMRLPDLGDVYLPYLKFYYTFNGLNYEHAASMGVFQTKFFLPEYPAVDFLPSTHGFKFSNSFSGYFLPYTTPAFLSFRKVTSKYGLCGGMCAAAYDFVLSGKPIMDTIEVPNQGTRMQRYLFRRQMDSLGGLGKEIVKVAQWTSLPDDTTVGTMRRTADELDLIRQKLDQKNPVVLALIYVRASSLSELSKVIFNNHQVLAYAYQVDNAGVYTIRVYDPNLPGRDDAVIRAEPVELGEEPTSSGMKRVLGYKSMEQLSGAQYRQVRGFFIMPYRYVKPPKGI